MHHATLPCRVRDVFGGRERPGRREVERAAIAGTATSPPAFRCAPLVGGAEVGPAAGGSCFGLLVAAGPAAVAAAWTPPPLHMPRLHGQYHTEAGRSESAQSTTGCGGKTGAALLPHCLLCRWARSGACRAGRERCLTSCHRAAGPCGRLPEHFASSLQLASENLLPPRPPPPFAAVGQHSCRQAGSGVRPITLSRALFAVLFRVCVALLSSEACAGPGLSSLLR